MKKGYLAFICLSFMVLLAACGSPVTSQSLSSRPLTNDALNHNNTQQQNALPASTPTPAMSIPSQQATPTPKPGQSQSHSSSPSSYSCVTFSNDTTHVPAKSGGLASPYGSPPNTSQAQTYASQLFQLINHDRAACGLPAFAWNSTLSHGALLHSWNMAHCGFSHTCPDGMSQCQRIANEGFAGRTDCGECIGGTVNSWASISAIQEGMEHEPVTGWHRIHLFSTTLHYIGIGVYIGSGGYVWFTEDLVS
ncbi:MAG TPA: CAP domain-containing protein [Ktedonobacteraceae bacterium]